MIQGRKPFLKIVALSLFAISGAAFAQNHETNIRPANNALPSTTAVEYNLPPNKLSAEVVYLTLAADLSLYRGRPDLAYQTYMSLAVKTRDPRYAELAYKVAAALDNPQAAVPAASLLKELAPNAVLGQDLLTVAKISSAYASIDKQEYRPAYEAAKELLAQNPKNVGALSLLTDVADRLGYDKEALQAAEAWVKLEPDNSEALNSLGYFLANKNTRLSEAEQLIKKANQIKPNTPHILDSMGWVAYRQGRLDDAVPFLKQAVTMDPHEEVLTHLGEVLWQKGDRDEAMKTFKAAYQANSFSPVLRDTLERLGIALNSVSTPAKPATPKKGTK